MTDAAQPSTPPTLDRVAPARGFVYSEQDRRMVDTLKALSADAVEKAGHGHPGTAISLAPVAWQLYQNVMHLDPTDDRWEGRDRFILSAGHASLIQYLQLFAPRAPGSRSRTSRGCAPRDPGPRATRSTATPTASR